MGPGEGADYVDVTVDAPPSIVINTPGGTPVVPAGTPVPISATITDSNLASWKIGANGSFPLSGTEANPNVSLDTTGWPDGSYPVVLSATDAYGSTSTASFTVVIDNTYPDLDFWSIVDNQWIGQQTLGITATSLAPDLALWEIYVDGNSQATGSLSPFSHGFAVPVTWLNNERHDIAVSVWDTAGNRTTVTKNVYVDLKKPNLTVTHPVVGDTIGGDYRVKGTLRDNGSGPSSVDVQLVSLRPNGNCSDNVVRSANTADAVDGTFSTRLALTGVPDGSYCVVAVGRDLLGNEVTEKLKTVQVDGTAPDVPTSLAPTGWQEDGDTTFTWTPSTESGLSFEIVVDDDPDLGDAPIFDQTTSDPTFSAGNLDPGTYWWKVRAIDAVGNKSDWSDKVKLDIIGVPVVSLCGCGTFGRYLDIEWTEANAPGGVQRYEIQVGYDGDPSVSSDDFLFDHRVNGVTTTFTRQFRQQPSAG